MSKSKHGRKYDALHMGRSCIDLYSTNIGAPFSEIKEFAAYVGGSPTNMSVGGRRLGLNVALLTAIGDDPVGDFILAFLNKEGVETQFCPRKPGHRTSAVLLGMQPPDKFPLVFYRDNCADKYLDLNDVMAAPLDDCRVFQFAGTNLSVDPSRTATMMAAERARKAGASVILDIDFRPDQWPDPRWFGITLRTVLHLVDIVIGTQDEINALMMQDARQVCLTDSQMSDTRVSGKTEGYIPSILSMGPGVVIEKRGSEGCRIHTLRQSAIDVPGFPVEIQNILGAGDAFGAGFIFGFVNDWELYRAARLGNACGALVVTRHGCSISMPSYEEVMDFMKAHGER